jgi:CBS domain-containing protein
MSRGMRSAASVGDVMRARDQIAVVGADATVRRVVRVMLEASVEGVLVIDRRGRVVGAVGDEQLVRRANERQTRPWWRRVADRDAEPAEGFLDLGAREVMLTRVVCVSPDLSFSSALRYP